MRLASQLGTALLLAPAALLPAGPSATPIGVPGSPSAVFSLAVSGVAMPVVAYKDIHYAQVFWAPGVNVEIALRNGDAVESASVHPTGFGIKPTLGGNRIRFDVDRPRKLLVQVNFLPKLFLFFEPPDAAVAETQGTTVVLATSAGAKPDGTTDCTGPIQRAIDNLPKDGLLLFPAGHYRTGSLRMRSDTTLHLAAGALLQAVDRHTQIAPMPGGDSMIIYIQAHGVTNLTLSGPGTIDANGFVVRRAYEAAEKIPKKPGRAVAIADSRNIRLSDITIRDSYSWNVHAFCSDDIEFQNVKILSDVRLSNHDGIDIDRCNNVLVQDCFIFSEDDALSPKARPGRAVVENLTFRDCVLWVHKANGIRVGSETDCDVMRNFLFENIHILCAADGIRLDCARGAKFENLTFRNIWMENFLDYYDPRFERDRERTPAHPSRSISLLVGTETNGRPPGRIDGVVFENVHWADQRVPARIEITDAAKKRSAESGGGPLIHNVVFRRCTRDGRPIAGAEDLGIRLPQPHDAGIRFEPENAGPPQHD